MKRSKVVGIMLILWFSTFGLTGVSGAVGNVDPALIDTIAQKGSSDFIIQFNGKTDLSPAYSMEWQARGEFVYRALTETAARSQAQVKAYFDDRSVTYTSFIAGNEMFVRDGTVEMIFELTSFQNVSFIREPLSIELDPDALQANPIKDGSRDQSWAIPDIHADSVWSDFGSRGEGIVMAEIGTGVQWNHPALVDAYRCGADPASAYCWNDPSNICGGSMCDNNGFSTNMMGMMVGSDDPGMT
ncbi:hypothetical protein JW979_03890, partial [bacterium]|nr:hypothetical protein [candidate division CSSED10-310 bacterium]